MSKPDDKPDNHGHITIFLAVEDADDKPFTIHPGTWQVDALKKELGVADALILASVVNTEVKTYPDGDHFKPFEGQVFFGQSRGGGAS